MYREVLDSDAYLRVVSVEDSQVHLSVCLSVFVCPIFTFYHFHTHTHSMDSERLRRSTGKHMCNFRRETTTQCRDDRQSNDAPYVTLLEPPGRSERKRQSAISAIGTFRDVQDMPPRGEVEHAITNFTFSYLFRFFFSRFAHSQAVLSVYTIWVCGVLFFFSRHICGICYRGQTSMSEFAVTYNTIQVRIWGIRHSLP